MVDSLNPSKYPQFRTGPGRYHGRALAAAAALRAAPGYEPEICCVPDDSNIDVAASSTFEGRVSVPAGSYVWALAATSSQAEGFDIQIRDASGSHEFFGRQIHWDNATGQGSAQGISHPLFVLPKPWLVMEPGQLAVQIWNNAAAVNTIQIAVFVARRKQ